MKKGQFFRKSLLTCALVMPLSAYAAEGISYSFIEADYLIQNIDYYEDNDFFDNFAEDFDDGDGYNISASFDLSDSLFTFGSYGSTDSEFSYFDDTGGFVSQSDDVKTLKLGLGFHTPLSDSFDLVASGGYIDVDLGDFSLGRDENDDLNSGDDIQNAFNDLNDDDSDGYFLDLGGRAQLASWLEFGAGVRYTDLDYGDNTSLFGNVLFELSDNLGVNLGGDFGDEISTYSLGLRYSF
tara:strand:+ start:821 stop:1534 length:714 start_codon:yes stop_codon:yes gene_type:complete